MENKVGFDLITMFNEAEKQLNRQFESFGSLRKYAESIMGIASIIVSFFATFGVFDSSIVKNYCFYVLFVIIAIAYSVLMILSILVMKPSSIESPIGADLDNYNEAYADKSERAVVASQVALYTKTIKNNEKNLVTHSRLVDGISGLLGFLVLLILLATISLLV